MQAHDHIVKDLNKEFKKVDEAFETNEVRVFGKNTGRIFKELDVLRRKQLDIASNHVSLESIQDIPTQAHLMKSNQDSTFLKSFERKELLLKSMMQKLDDITQSMDTFRKICEQDYTGPNTLISSENEHDNDKNRQAEYDTTL